MSLFEGNLEDLGYLLLRKGVPLHWSGIRHMMYRGRSRAAADPLERTRGWWQFCSEKIEDHLQFVQMLSKSCTGRVPGLGVRWLQLQPSVC